MSEAPGNGDAGMVHTARVVAKDATDKVVGLAKFIVGFARHDPDLRQEGSAQLDQAHVEPEDAAVRFEEGGGPPRTHDPHDVPRTAPTKNDP